MARFDNWQETIWKQTEAIAKDLEKVYREAEKELQKDLAVWLEKYYYKHGLELSDLKKIMNSKDAAKFRMSVKDYMDTIEALGNHPRAETLLKELNVMAGRVRYQRYEELLYQIKVEQTKLGVLTEQATEKHLRAVIEEGYNRTLYEVAKDLSIHSTFNHIRPDRIEQILSAVWSENHFSDNIWKNMDKLTDNLNKAIANGIIQGHEFRRMSEELQRLTGNTFFNSRRVLETETSYFLGQGRLDAYGELGTEKYKFVATLDTRTSERCQQLDGKVFRVKDAQVGVNYSPMHPFCRSTSVVYFEDQKLERAYRKPGGKTETGEYMTYDEFKNKYIKQSFGGLLETGRTPKEE